MRQKDKDHNRTKCYNVTHSSSALGGEEWRKKEEKKNPPWKRIGKKGAFERAEETGWKCVSQYLPARLSFTPLLPRTWLAVWLNDRKSRVRRPSCRRRRRRLIRLPANPVASDGATAGWMNMITHSPTGLTPQLHLSRLSLLICLRAAACLQRFWLPPAVPRRSRLRHSGVESELRGGWRVGGRSGLLCMRCSQLLTRDLVKSGRKGGSGVGQHEGTLISAAWMGPAMEAAATGH